MPVTISVYLSIASCSASCSAFVTVTFLPTSPFGSGWPPFTIQCLSQHCKLVTFLPTSPFGSGWPPFIIQCLSQHCKLVTFLLSPSPFGSGWPPFTTQCLSQHCKLVTFLLSTSPFGSGWPPLIPISALQVSDFSAVNFPLWFMLATVHYLTTFSVYLSIGTSVSISDFHSVGGSVCVCVCVCSLRGPFTSFHCLKVKVQVFDVAAEFVQDSADVGAANIGKILHKRALSVWPCPRRREGSRQMKVFTCLLSLAHEFGNVRLSDAVATEEATGHICHFNGQLFGSACCTCPVHIVAQSRQESISACQRNGRGSISQ